MGLGSSKTGQLTADELELIRSTWEIVMKNPEENGIVIFKKFLEKHDYYSHFKKFSGIPLEELPNNQVFRRHAAAIINALNNIALHIDNESILKSELYSLGKMHKVRKITEQQFEELKAVMLDVLKNEFKLPEEGLNAWNKTLDIAFIYIFEGLRGDELSA